MSALEAAFDQLPEPILNKLGSMIRRVRRLLFIRGLCATLAVALACVLVIMSIDAALTLFSSSARWALSLGGLLITTIACIWFLIRPLSRRITLTEMARIIEIRHPELQERISTAVELLSSDDPDSIKGSEELISAVVDSAIEDVDAVDPRSEFNPIRTARVMAIMGGFAIIIAATLAIWPQQSWTLLTRAVAPFLDIGNAYADSLVVEPGDVRVVEGDSVTITLAVNHKKLRRAEIRRQLNDETESVERMTLVSEDEDGTRHFMIRFPKVNESFSYRIRAGSALTRYYKVDTVIPPLVDRLTIAYDYPEYTALPDKQVVTATGEIRAVSQTSVTVTAAASKPVHSANLTLNGSTEIGAPQVEGENLIWMFDLKPGMNGNWQIELTDSDGFSNSPSQYPIEVLPDKAPTVQVFQPGSNEMILRPTERLQVSSNVIEDFGFTDVSLLVTPVGIDAAQKFEAPLPIATGNPGAYLSAAQLNLSLVSLSPGQKRLAVQVQVRDSRPSDYDGPGIGLSDPFFITLDEEAKSLAEQAVEAKRRAVDQQIREAKQELEKSRNDIRRAEQEAKRSEEVTDRLRNPLREFSEHTESARNKLDEIAASLDETLLQEQADQARQLADGKVADAREQADLIPITDGREERVKEARDARAKIEDAIKDLDKIAQAIKEAVKDFEMITELNNLADKQEKLAMKAREWAEEAKQRAEAMGENPSDPSKEQLAQQQQMDKFREEQEQVQQELGEMLKDNAAALDEILQSQQNEADQLSKEALALAEEQQELMKINADATQAAEDGQKKLREQLIDHLRKQQEQLAQETKAKSEASPTEPDPSATTDDSALAEAAAETHTAAAQLGEKDLESAAETAAKASESLAEAASNQKPDASAQPGEESIDSEGSKKSEPGDAPLPTRAELAERQQALAEQIELVKGGNLQAALSQIEAQLDREAQALQQNTGALEESLKNLSQQTAQSGASRAEQALDRGAQDAADSANQLAAAEQQQDQAVESGQVSPDELSKNAEATMQRARSEQQKSASSFEQASKALAASSQAIGQTLDGLEPSDQDSNVADSGELAEGFEEVTESARSTDAQEAAQQSQEASDSLQQLAQSAMDKMGGAGKQQKMPNSPSPADQQEMTGDPDSTALNESGMKAADANGDTVPPELQRLGISAEDWSRFKGALVGGNAASIETELPVEYRELVGRYFQVIAKEAGKNE